jgi:hypothetical protein
MAVILGSTGVTFPDSSTQTTAKSGTVTSIATGTGLTGGTITTTGTLSVNLSLGVVGAYGMMYTTGISVDPGNTLAGSNLRYSSMYQNASVIPSGTWQCMGLSYDQCSSGRQYITAFVRIA